MSRSQSSLFLSHGSPMMAFAEPDDPYFRALRQWAERNEKPRAVLVVSAHGVSTFPSVEIFSGQRHELLYDFAGFPKELYQIEYPCAGAPEVAVRAASLLAAAGFQAQLNARGRLDHGVWVPLRILFPEADVPVLQLTLPFPADPRWILKLGQALSPLRREGAVHNLEKLRWDQKHGPGADWALRFEDWIWDCLRHKDVERLLSFENEAPEPLRAHPTFEHFYPMLFTVGAACEGDEAIGIFRGIEYRTLSMLCFALEHLGDGEPADSGRRLH